MSVYSHGRVRVFPGKHGAGDYRVEINGMAVTHSELVAIYGAISIAEDRYDKPWQDGRWRIMGYMSKAFALRSFDELDGVVKECANDKRMPTSDNGSSNGQGSLLDSLGDEGGI